MLPPARFEIKKDKVTTTTLQVWWSPSLGKVDWYELQLLNGIEKVEEIPVPGGISRSDQIFANLIPGNKYTITIRAVAGNKKSSSVDISGSTGKNAGDNNIIFTNIISLMLIISIPTKKREQMRIPET